MSDFDMEDVTQRISITVQNNLKEGSIFVKNVALTRGQPFEKSDRLSLISAEDVNKKEILAGEEDTISFCGSAVYGLGVEGSLDLYHNPHGWIASLYWYGPWNRLGNRFEITRMDSENYSITVSPIRRSGILGDISVSVTQVV